VELEATLVDENGAVGDPASGASVNSLRLRAANRARQAVLAMRRSGEIGDVAFHRLEEEIDRMEMSAT
jgi:monovalent cation/hydrogen antiporter